MNDGHASPTAERLRRAHGLLLAAVILCAGLFASTVYLALRGRHSPAAALEPDPAVREAAVARLVELSGGIWDTFPDPDVGRVLQPNLQDREAFGVPISTNAFGWREKPVALPKPQGTVRIVLLGDSFIFGPRISLTDRIAPFLEQYVRERARRPPRAVEVVQIGMASWNIRAEAAYLRRSLSSLSPDLVVQVVVSNDLDDSGSARGFGVVSDFSSQHYDRTAMIYDFYPIWGLGFPGKASYMNAGLSYEARHRYLENASWLGRLESAVTTAGGEYLVLISWADQPKTAAKYLGKNLPARSVLYLPESFRRDTRFRISDSDPHWSRPGSEHLAKFLYGALRDRKLLVALDLAPWPEAEEIFRTLDAAGLEEADLAAPLDLTRWSAVVGTAVDFRQLTAATAPQVYGGVGSDGLVSPYAAVLLRRNDARRIRILGSALPALELRGTPVRVYVEEFQIGTTILEPGEPIELTYELPGPVLQRPFLDVRFTANDWIYAPADLRRCVVFRLDRVETLP